MGQSDAPSSGFTAVNGDRQTNVSFRPDETKKDNGTDHDHAAQLPPGKDPSSVQYHSHGWSLDGTGKYRQADGYTTHRRSPESTESRKRKRSYPAVAENGKPTQSIETHDNIAESPKRRATNMDSAVDVSSPVKTRQASPAAQSEKLPAVPPSVRAYSGERLRWNPPPFRPEIEAGLAEALQRELQSAHQAQADSQAQARARKQVEIADDQMRQFEAEAGAESPSPPAEAYGQHQQHSYSPEQDQDMDMDMDSKKRKRNFSNRTKTGCHTCRGRKKKCDERKPGCQNCERGSLTCGGYGPKPPGGFKSSNTSTRPPVTLQSKPRYEAVHGPTGYYQNPADEQGRSYPRWGRGPLPEHDAQHPPIIDSRHPTHRSDSWPKPPSWPTTEPAYMPPRHPPTDLSTALTLHAYAPIHHSLPPVDPWADHHAATSYRPLPSVGPVISSRESGSTTSSQRTAALALAYNSNAQLTEKDKMLLGRPFLHFIDEQLYKDRQECKSALELWNDAARSTSHVSTEEQGRFFKRVIDPTARSEYGRRDETYTGPKGRVGSQTIIESPFKCDYGYNIHIGEEIVIQAGCYMQDACEIQVGDRTIIGPNVRFYGITASVDAAARKGIRTTMQGGAITVGEDCFIGADVIIMPFRKIGNGAVVGAGSVVTKDVKENTVVAGNPAKVIRRIEPGPNVDRHHPDIQEQNERMLHEMWEKAKRHPDR
ncbi:hypothetical protein LTR65_008140 [Meristemomyces frigidus]